LPADFLVRQLSSTISNAKLSMIKYVPAVEVPVFVFGYEHKIFEAVVKAVVVDVVDDHPSRALSYKSMHTNHSVLAVNAFSKPDVVIVA